MMRWKTAAAGGGPAAALGRTAGAQSYPNGTIKILVGFPPGGTTDIIARDVGQELEKAWHTTVIVENRAGANGALAAAQLAKLPPDGQTLMMIVSGHITNPLIMPNAGYDAIKDFTPISLLASSPLLIFAHPSFPANDIKGAIALAKEKPNTIGYATPGVGSIQQLSMELLSYLSGAKFLHVPYRGGAPALNDTIAGHVPISVLSVFQVLPLIQDGKLKPLAVTAPQAQRRAAERADGGRGRGRQLRGVAAVRPDRAGRLASRDARQDQCRGHPHHQRPGDAKETRRAGRAADRKLAGGIHGRHAGRAEEVGPR